MSTFSRQRREFSAFSHEIGKEREEEQFVSGMTLKFETRTATRRAFDPQRLSA
jgi:hypothetical protein